MPPTVENVPFSTGCTGSGDPALLWPMVSPLIASQDLFAAAGRGGGGGDDDAMAAGR